MKKGKTMTIFLLLVNNMNIQCYQKEDKLILFQLDSGFGF